MTIERSCIQYGTTNSEYGGCSLSLYLMRFANTVVIVTFERLRFLPDVFREKYFSLIKQRIKTSTSLSTRSINSPPPPPSRVKNIAWKFLKFSSLFLDTRPSISSNGFCRSVHYNPINCHGCLSHLSDAFLDFDNYLVSL